MTTMQPSWASEHRPVACAAPPPTRGELWDTPLEQSAIGSDATEGQQARQGRTIVERAKNGRYQWRLKSPNGRIVAVSSPIYAGPKEAEEALTQLRRDGVRLLGRMRHVKDGAGWFWMIRSEQGQPQARSMRAYERYATSKKSFQKFLDLLNDSGRDESAAASRESGS